MMFAEFEALVGRHTRARREMCNVKGTECAHSEDRLANFKRVGTDLGLRPESVLMVYMQKHMDSIRHYIAGGCKDTGSERIVGRVYDVQNYCDLLLGLIFERGKGA